MDYRCPHCAGVAKPINGAEDTIKCEGEVHCQFMGSKDDFEWVGNEAVSSEAPGYDDYKPSKLYWHEALDRSSLACDFFHENVAEHPAVQNDIELKNMAEKMVELMADFYQYIGRKSSEFDDLETES